MLDVGLLLLASDGRPHRGKAMNESRRLTGALADAHRTGDPVTLGFCIAAAAPPWQLLVGLPLGISFADAMQRLWLVLPPDSRSDFPLLSVLPLWGNEPDEKALIVLCIWVLCSPVLWVAAGAVALLRGEHRLGWPLLGMYYLGVLVLVVAILADGLLERYL